jgi:hypothetical protein
VNFLVGSMCKEKKMENGDEFGLIAGSILALVGHSTQIIMKSGFSYY